MNGTILKRKLKSGTSWGYSFFAGRDANGKRIQEFRSGFKTKGEADTAVRKAIADHERTHGKITHHRGVLGTNIFGYVFDGEQKTGFADQSAAAAALSECIARKSAAEEAETKKAAASDPKFSDYLHHWLDEHARRRCAPKTLERYRELAEYLVRQLGETRLNDLTTAQIQDAVHRLQDCGGRISEEFPNGRPLAAKTVRHIATLLSTSLAEALRLEVLKRPHPMANKLVRLPKLVKRKPPVLDKEKLRELFDRARGTRLYPFIVLGAATGCRRGELLALLWSDLNEATGELNVTKSVEQTKAGLRIKCPKGEEPRQFVVPDWAVAVLAERRKEQANDRAMFGESYEDHGLIFCQPNGAYYSPDRIGARVVELMRAVGLYGVSLHSLRHSHASELLSLGVPVPVVAERLGHKDQNITLSIYSHAMPADTRAAAKAWNDAMSEVMESSTKPVLGRMLADVSSTETDGRLFVENKGKKMAGTTGFEPDKRNTDK